MEQLKSISYHYPEPLVIEQRMIDVNMNVVEKEVVDEYSNEKSIQYEYDTYRFRNYAEYTAWLNEQKDKEIRELKERNALLEECVMELSIELLGGTE